MLTTASGKRGRRSERRPRQHRPPQARRHRRVPAPTKKKLSYLEAREYATIEQRVEEAEQRVQVKHAQLEDPANATDAARLVSVQAELDAAQEALDALYTRWAELEKKNG